MAADDDVAAGAQPAVGAERDAVAEVVEHENLLGFGDADFPGEAGVLDRAEREAPVPPIVAGDEDDVGIRFGHARRDGADAGFGDELDADARARVHFLQVVNELREVLDGIDVVVRRRADQGGRRAWCLRRRAMRPCDFVGGQLPAFAGLGALGHLDLDLLGVGHQVFPCSRRSVRLATCLIFELALSPFG